MSSNSTEHASTAGARRARWAVTGGIGLAAALGMSAFILLPAGATPSDKVTICQAARLVLTQTLLGANGPRSLGPIEGLMYLAPACSAWLLAGSAVLELPAMRREGAWEVVMVSVSRVFRFF